MAKINPLPIELIFERPYESLITGRKDWYFDIPADFLPIGPRKVREKGLAKASPDKIIKVPKLEGTDKPDISVLETLPWTTMFNIFLPSHRDYSAQLIRIFATTPIDKLLSTLVYVRENINPLLFFYSASVVLQHRSETKHVRVPYHLNLFPNSYINNNFITKANEQSFYYDADERIPVKIPMDYTATNLDPEHHVAYWREDVGVNQHHWHWHTVYPHSGEITHVAKDRRGELFYYMHEQMIARYNFERLSCGLARVKAFDNFRTAIFEGYYPKLDSSVASRFYPPRQASSMLSDIKRDDLNIPIHDLERWRDEVINSIYKGYMKKGENVFTKYTLETGIDVLGNLIEASDISPNKDLYGDLHNFGHAMISAIHDPDNRYKEQLSVMGDLATAMRDPIFYVWHKFVNDIFVRYKATLPGYTKDELSLDGIKISNVELQYNDKSKKKDAFYTKWDFDDVDVSYGLNFRLSEGGVYIRLTHLNHEEFDYKITVNNTGKERDVTVRIFLAPKYDESWNQFSFDEQRHCMVELDKFLHHLPCGSSTIPRKSTESNVTIPFKQIFNNPDSSSTKDPMCKCGWPDYLLLPKGTAAGFMGQLFVMLSSGDDLTVNKDKIDYKVAASYCGLDTKKYPDKQKMGYPFDRVVTDTLIKGEDKPKMQSQYFLTNWVANYDNMFVLETTTYHNETMPAENAPMKK